MKTVIVTGVAGFIGFSVAKKFISEGWNVVGVDCVNDYYDVALKEARLDQLEAMNDQEQAEDGQVVSFPQKVFSFHKFDLAQEGLFDELVKATKPSRVVHLAAQPGVRYSLENPFAYIESNVMGHMRVLEACRHYVAGGAEDFHLLYASSSSVYGGNDKVPYAESDPVDHPQSLYAATKKADELFSDCYAHLYKVPMSGLRFFTVYGPWGRPDMSPMLFASAIAEGRPINVFNYGEMWRDFTYIDDIVEGIYRLSDVVPTGDLPHEVYNIGNNTPVTLKEYIETMETVMGAKAEWNLMPMQPGDVLKTYADTDKIFAATGWKPDTPLEEGLKEFADWFNAWHASSEERSVA